MIDFLKRASDGLDRVSLFAAVIAILLILVISIYGAFFRYILDNPLPWPLPVERLLMIWAALLGIPAALKRSQHMGVEGLIRQLPRPMEKMIRYLNYAIVGTFVLCLGWYGWLEFIGNSDLYMISAQTRISSRWFTAAVPVSAFIQGVHLLCAPHMIQAEMADRTDRPA